MHNDYYQILGVSRDASQAEIKKAYRKLSKEWHPDRHPSTRSTGSHSTSSGQAGQARKEAEQKYKEINRAYEVLSDSKKKQAYDSFGSEDGPSFDGVYPGQSRGAQGKQYGGFGGQGFEGFGAGGLGDIFETFFGGGRSRPAEEHGRDAEMTVKIPLSEAFTGARKTIRLKKRVSCGECEGSGAMRGSKTVACGPCNGTGQVTRTAQSFFGVIRQSAVCDRCRGSGKVPESACGTCGGEGRVAGAEEIRVEIPPGIGHGQTLKVRGKGEAGRQGAAAGDLYVTVAVASDPRFEREGDDLKTAVTIPVPDSVLGTEVSVGTFEGNITVRIPAGTQPGQVLRLRGRGMPVLNASRRGDLYVRIVVEVPKKVGRRERGLWEELKRE